MWKLAGAHTIFCLVHVLTFYVIRQAVKYFGHYKYVIAVNSVWTAEFLSRASAACGYFETVISGPEVRNS